MYAFACESAGCEGRGRSGHDRMFARGGEFRRGCAQPSGSEAYRYAADSREALEGYPGRRTGMIPQNFEYSSPANLQEALGLIADGNAKVLAGGMSLIPLMKLRLAAPGHVVDISRIPGLSYIREEAGTIHVGAMTTHYDV